MISTHPIRLTLVFAIVAASLGLTPSSSASGPGVVTFPNQTTAFNPDIRPYVASVATHADPSPLYARWNGAAPNTWTELPASGDQVIFFPTGTDGTGVVEVLSCTDTSKTSCTLTGDVSPTITVDRGSPTVALSLSSPTVYPVVDGYLDTIAVKVTADESSSIDVAVLDANLVRRASWSISAVAGTTYTRTFNGRSNVGALLPAGRYHVVASATDPAENVGQRLKPLTIDMKQLVLKTFKRTFGPSTILGAKFVGKCSVLRSPSLRGWRGSLGYYSNKRCKGREFVDTVAESDHGPWVPLSFQGKYGTLRVTAYGGAATKRPGSKGGIWYYRPGGQTWLRAGTLGSAVRSYPMVKVQATPYINYDDGRPYVWFAVGAVEGNWYDVKTLTVELTFYRLQ